ncbi:hypothetical protein K8R66_02195 [bacterium]|nr:hypothetical protein [bacterium]
MGKKLFIGIIAYISIIVLAMIIYCLMPLGGGGTDDSVVGKGVYFSLFAAGVIVSLFSKELEIDEVIGVAIFVVIFFAGLFLIGSFRALVIFPDTHPENRKALMKVFFYIFFPLVPGIGFVTGHLLWRFLGFVKKAPR